MFYPNYLTDTNTRAMVDTWRGYNHNYRIGAGEFYDMENLSSDNYPLLTPRKARAKLIEAENIRGILLTENKLCYLEGTKLHYGAKVYDLSDYVGDETGHEKDEQQLIRFGAYILIFPLHVYVNLTDDEDIGNMESSYTVPAGKTISYIMCDTYGNAFADIKEGTTAPANPSDGAYWLNTTEGEEGLNIWVESVSMWQPVATTYIRITIPDAKLTESFSEGDTVTFNSGVNDINAGSAIQKLTNTSMVIIGILPHISYTEDTTDTWQLTVERKLPDLDFICTNNNRVWGCHYGKDAQGKLTNEIYASKLGDFKNWYSFNGISTDSYAASIGEDGRWTGCITYQGKPTFFKENAIFRVYGNMPSEYQIVTNNARGVQYGSEKSLAILNEYLIYKSPVDVVIYDGATPTSISQAFGRDRIYYDAAAGATLNKYYISMQDSIGRFYYFVYDLETNLWMREDAKNKLIQFTTSEAGQIYAHNGKVIYGIGANDNMLFLRQLAGETNVSWWAETGDIGFEYPDHKKVSKIAIRAYVPFESEIEVWISYDDKAFEQKAVIRGNNETKTKIITIQPMRCDHYRLRFKGLGYCRIYTMSTTLDGDGGEYD